MEKDIIFSVLVPVYNVEKYINQCITSIVGQTYPSFELILLDDGSTDSSGAICDSWKKKDSRVKVIHRKNKGLFQTRLDEIDVANGDYLVFIDSDDYVKPELLLTLAQLLRKHTADIVTYGREIIDPTGKTIPYPIHAYPDETILTQEHRSEVLCRALQNNDITSIWSKCVRKRLIQPIVERLREYGRLNMGEDMVFSTWLYSRYSVLVYTDLPLYCYRRDGSGMSIRSSYKYFNDTIVCSRAQYDALISIGHEINGSVMELYWKRQWHGRIYFLKSYLLQGIGREDYTLCYFEQKKLLKNSVFTWKILTYKILYGLLHPVFFPIWRRVFAHGDN